MARIAVPKTYDPGDMITLYAQFYDKDRNPADPTDCVLKIRNPLGVQQTFIPIHDGDGKYHYDFDTNLSYSTGRYTYRFEGTGAVTSAEEKVFFLNPSDFS